MKLIWSLIAVLLLPSPSAAADDDRRERIEAHLATEVAIEGVRGPSLADRMRELDVAAISYAVIDGGKIVFAAAHGFGDVADNRAAPVLPSSANTSLLVPPTRFQAASISKPVTAMAVLDLVERGVLRLDEPVSSILRSWRLPENELTASTPVTLRQLLSHSAGTTVHGFPGYPADEPRPTLAQLLSGETPANTQAVVVDIPPGTRFRYSGGGTTVVQAVLIDRTGLPFPELMQRTVLGPLGMHQSTYEQPLPPAWHRTAASGHDATGKPIEGRWHVYPEMAAAGLWTTPVDLAKVVLEMQTALAGRSSRLLSIDAAEHMLRPRFEGMGLGFAVQLRDGARYFTHSGSNRGFRAILIGSLENGRGLVVMSNSENAPRAIGQLVNTVAREYGWPGYVQVPLQQVSLDDSTAGRYTGRYRLPSGELITIRRTGEVLEVLDLTHGWIRLYPVSGGVLARSDQPTRYRIEGEALAVVRNATSSNPASVVTTRVADDVPLLAEELLALGRIEEAKQAFRERFLADPEALAKASLSRRAYSFVQIGRGAEALALLELGVELTPSSAGAWDDLAEGRELTGDTAGAAAAYQEVLRRVDADETLKPERREALRKSAARALKRLR
jgi:CubicO group peptidase (beta-lactamase class C family)